MLIKKWSIKFTENYGKGYDVTNLRKFRQFYNAFPKCAPVGRAITWSHIREILPIKDINERNYYINLCIERNLSKRKLIEEIKSNSYERLVNKPEYIELIVSKKEYMTFADIKSPIIIKVDKNKTIKNEKDLELTILSEIEFILTQLGRIILIYYFFNIKMNCYVVVELKTRRLKVEDKAQVESYMKLVDSNLKETHHNKTMGIIITKEQDKYVANFVRSNDLISLTYEIIRN